MIRDSILYVYIVVLNGRVNSTFSDMATCIDYVTRVKNLIPGSTYGYTTILCNYEGNQAGFIEQQQVR